MRQYTDQELNDMTLRDAEVEISNEVYGITELFELLERKKKIFGNGHHIRQRVAKFAEDLMTDRWITDTEARCMERKIKNDNEK